MLRFAWVACCVLSCTVQGEVLSSGVQLNEKREPGADDAGSSGKSEGAPQLGQEPGLQVSDAGAKTGSVAEVDATVGAPPAQEAGTQGAVGLINSEADASAAAIPSVVEAGAATTASAVLVSVSAGDFHACAVAESGEAYCWGANGAGQLGSGDRQARGTPNRISFQAPWRQVAAGGRHTCGIDQAGQVYCWGAGAAGQLGGGNRQGAIRPARVVLPSEASELSIGSRHSCVLLVVGELYCWGHNFEGQLGLGDDYSSDEAENDSLEPARVAGPTDLWLSASAGQGHTCAVASDGTLWCWGRNTERQTAELDSVQLRVPTQMGADSTWQSIAAGQGHTCGLRNDGALWCWGLNTGGEQAGPLGSAVSQLDSPTQIESALRWRRLSSDTFHTCALTDEDELWCWGRNAEGQLGLGDTSARAEPSRVLGGILDISVGRFFSCVLFQSGALGCAGENDQGQLATGDGERASTIESIGAWLPL